MEQKGSIALLSTAVLVFATGCGPAEREEPRWPPGVSTVVTPPPAPPATAAAPATTQVESATLPIAYCSARYQAQFGWPDPEKAARVCQCESNGNPRAV